MSATPDGMSNRHVGRYLGLAQGWGGGGGGLRGPQDNPLQNQKLFGFGPLFLGEEPHFTNKKIKNFLEKN